MPFDMKVPKTLVRVILAVKSKLRILEKMQRDTVIFTGVRISLSSNNVNCERFRSPMHRLYWLELSVPPICSQDKGP